MNPANPSLPLRDIHLPDPVSWWPPAPGWWLLLGILLLAPMLLLWWRKRRRLPAAAKLALNEFEKLQAAFQNHRDEKILVRELSVLLRRTCMTYTAREQSASLTGGAWIEQLNALGETEVFTPDLARLLLNAPYDKEENIDARALLQACSQWLRSLPRRPER